MRSEATQEKGFPIDDFIFGAGGGEPLPNKKKLDLFRTAPVTELSLPERIEEVLLPSAVRVPGFEGLISVPAAAEKKKRATKKKKPDDDDAGEGGGGGGGGKAAKRRKLEEGKTRAPAGSAPARSIAWNRYGTLLAGKSKERAIRN